MFHVNLVFLRLSDMPCESRFPIEYNIKVHSVNLIPHNPLNVYTYDIGLSIQY